MEWMLMPYRKLYAAIAGRSSRREFWMFTLLNVIIVVVFVALIFGVIGASMSLTNLSEVGGALAGAGIVGMFLLIIPLYFWALLTGVASLAVTVRRFHDLNMSGWLYVLFAVLAFIPFVNILSGIALIVMMCLKGTAGANKYGEDPTDTTGADVFA